MKNKLTKAQKFGMMADMILKKGPPVRRASDGAIPTHPVIPIPRPLPEAQVLADCLKWLRSHGIPCDRCNNGTARTESGYHVYGIKGSGDIHGWFPITGGHFEIECKAGKGGRLSKDQQERRDKILSTSACYLVVHDVSELAHYMRMWNKNWLQPLDLEN